MLRLPRRSLEPQRQHELLELACVRALGAQEQVLGQLLRQRRAALRNPSRAQIGEGRAHHARGIEPPVLEEAPVLGGDHRIDEMPRQEVDRHIGAVAAALAQAASRRAPAPGRRARAPCGAAPWDLECSPCSRPWRRRRRAPAAAPDRSSPGRSSRISHGQPCRRLRLGTPARPGCDGRRRLIALRRS